MNKINKVSIPFKIYSVLEKINKAGFEAFLVGGCVRDLMRGKKPNDWDITTSAKPEEILKIFPDGKYENTFGTVILPDKYISEESILNLDILSNKIKIDQNLENKIKRVAKKYLKKIECPAHNVDHIKRMIETARQIQNSCGRKIDFVLVEILIWLHDIGRAVDDKLHIKKGQEIVKKEFGVLLGDKELKSLVKAINYKHSEKSVFLEQQILKEADLIDALNVERTFSFKTEEEKDHHLDWLKKNFTNEKLYSVFKTIGGRKILKEAIKQFNEESFPFDLKMPNWRESNLEITTYRLEAKYSDNRHPDQVKFTDKLADDLKRRDFTVNAMALGVNFNNNFDKSDGELVLEKSKDDYEIIDLFNGQQDLVNRVIRAVGNPDERFQEDALRMMRAVRFAAQFSEGDDLQFLKERKVNGNQNQKTGYRLTVTNSQFHIVNRELMTDDKKWWIGEKTFQSIKKNSRLLKNISKERIRDELIKIILSDRPAWGVELLVETGLMKYIIPEIYETIGVKQNRHHYYGPFNTVYKHMLASLKKCPSQKLEVRLASFFHDIGKPRAKRGSGYLATFHGHEYIGARMTQKILERLKFPRKIVDKTVLLVKNHMFYYNVDEVGEKGVRKVIRKVGLENINDLIDVRIADRLGSGVPKAVPYRLRHFKYMVEKVSKDPISVKDLKINGDILIEKYGFKPGPEMGAILEILLAEVLDNPKLNTLEYLSKRAIELQKENLQQLRQIAKNKIEEEKEKEKKEIKDKYWVK